MKAHEPKRCPGCASARLGGKWKIEARPVILNYRFTTAKASQLVPRRDLTLRECSSCGLIFNSSLDSSVIPYDEAYENRQSFSPYFRRHLNAMSGLLEEYGVSTQSRVLEVGCGKGEFLRLFCEQVGAKGDGFDTSYEGPATRLRGRVCFSKRYVRAVDLKHRYEVILCRHVVEHVGEIGAFLIELAAMAQVAGDPVVILETPAFEWIDRRTAFWDIFYEHCNYFTQACLAKLCRYAGFRVVRQRRVFGGQYQWIELKLDPKGRTRPGKSLSGCAPPRILKPFQSRVASAVAGMEERIRKASQGGPWAIWGAGAKGVAMLQWLKHDRPSFIIDSNPAKQGCFVPGTDVPIVGPVDTLLKQLSLVMIANPNYRLEISSILRERGFAQTIICA